MIESSVPSPSKVSTQPNLASICSGSRFSVGVPIASPTTPKARLANAPVSSRSVLSAAISPITDILTALIVLSYTYN